MIRFLRITDLAVIDTVELELDAGLTILTGETGAGKSIVGSALALLRGARASASLVRTGMEKAVVEAVAETVDGTEHTLRREVSTQGRSRAYLDNRLVPTNNLRALGATLLDLYGQHEHQALLDPGSHLELLDQFAGLQNIRTRVHAAFDALQDTQCALEEMRSKIANRRDRLDAIAHQLRQIEEIAPLDSEDEELAAERHLLANADRIHRLAAESYTALYDGDGAALERLHRIWKTVEELATLDPALTPHLDAKDSMLSQLQELAYALRDHASGVEASPERLQTVEDRLAKLERLKRRYGPPLADVIAQRSKLRAEQEELDDTIDLHAQQERVDAAQATYLGIAQELSQERHVAAETLSTSLERSLADLAMSKTRIEVKFNESTSPEDWTERGLDHAEFHFSANPGEELRPLARIASGGELSRLMLALRTLTSAEDTPLTMVFDEVDAGIGGAAAEQVGTKLQALAKHSQILCVTHLPLIAACGRSHHLVTKSVHDGRTTTTIRRLDHATRASELARMMTGTQVTDAALRSARELLSSRRSS